MKRSIKNKKKKDLIVFRNRSYLETHLNDSDFHNIKMERECCYCGNLKADIEKVLSDETESGFKFVFFICTDIDKCEKYKKENPREFLINSIIYKFGLNHRSKQKLDLLLKKKQK